MEAVTYKCTLHLSEQIYSETLKDEKLKTAEYRRAINTDMNNGYTYIHTYIHTK